MNFWIGVGLLVVGLIVSIGLHELGHLLPAKRFGVYVPQYFIGFGPTLWSTKRGETEYGVKLLPLGGYVRLVGMFPPKPQPAAAKTSGLRGWMDSVARDARAYSQAEIPSGGQGRAFYSLSTPKKLAVMFGGPVVNLILSVVLFAIVLTGFGAATATNRLSDVSECVPADLTAECRPSDPVGPAAEAGFQAGDRVLTWGGQEVSTWEDVSTAIRAGGTEPTQVQVERGGQVLTLTVTPVMVERPVVTGGEVDLGPDGEPRMESSPYVGIWASYELIAQPVSAVPGQVWQVLTGTVEIVATLPARLVAIASAVFTDAERDPSIIGLVGVGRFAGEIASIPSEQYGLKERSADMLSLLASLNMALFVFNMIPLLPLDGGHIAGALFEGGRRRVAQLLGRGDPGFADTARLMPLTYVVFAVLVGMSLLLAVADIVKPVTLG